MKNYVTEYTQNGRRIIRGVGHYQPKPVSDLKQLVKNCAREYGNRTGFKFKNTQGKIVEKTYVELDQEIDRLGTALIARGFKGKRLAIISENRYEWGSATLPSSTALGLVYRWINTCRRKRSRTW